MRRIILIVHNVRSAHNAGALLRTADGLGLEKVIFSGYTPYPPATDDARMPHIAQRAGRAIKKTALGAESSVVWENVSEILDYLKKLAEQGYEIAALEQTASSQNLAEFKPPDKLALIVGNEVEGLEAELLNAVDIHLQIPMLGAKESFNVSSAAAMALYHLRYAPFKLLDKNSA